MTFKRSTLLHKGGADFLNSYSHFKFCLNTSAHLCTLWMRWVLINFLTQCFPVLVKFNEELWVAKVQIEQSVHINVEHLTSDLLVAILSGRPPLLVGGLGAFRRGWGSLFWRRGWGCERRWQLSTKTWTQLKVINIAWNLFLLDFAKVGTNEQTTCAYTMITTGRDCGSAEWINYENFHVHDSEPDG